MSQTFSLVCHATKQKCWAGQSSLRAPNGVVVYSAPDEARAIARFLQATVGHSVILLEDEKAPEACDDYEEFNDPSLSAPDIVVDKRKHKA